MDWRLTPIAIAIASCVMFSNHTLAAGGANGSYGAIYLGQHSSGGPGGTELNADGQSGGNIDNQNIASLPTPTGSISSPGTDAAATAGGGGIGGAGNGAVIAAFSQGGAGGTSTTSSANGGNGGALSNNTISLDYSSLPRLEITGGAGLNGGQAGSGEGASGAGGVGGASVIAALSQAGAGGSSTSSPSSAKGGDAGSISDASISLTNVTLNGATGGNGGQAGSGGSSGSAYGAAGSGGAGGASVIAGLSQAGAGGSSTSISATSAKGGDAGSISGVFISLTHATLNGATGGNGGQAGQGSISGYGAGGAGGVGGASVIAGLSQAGAGGDTNAPAYSYSSSAKGGDAGSISSASISLTNVTLNGAAGGNGGQAGSGASGYGAGGAGSVGGASILGGLSQAGGGGYSYSGYSSTSAKGGDAGSISGAFISLTNVTLKGAAGGKGGGAGTGTSTGTGTGGGGAGGNGGGSIFGGLSQGGAGGFAEFFVSGAPIDLTLCAYNACADGGNGGAVSNNRLILTDVTLDGTDAAGGVGGNGGTGTTAGYGAKGADGLNGGSIFGGVSVAGAGGYAYASDPGATVSANGGAAGDASNNQITLAGTSSLTGDIYGGYSQGGGAGQTGKDGGLMAPTQLDNGQAGAGGLAQNNHITLRGTGLSIAGTVYGGLSLNGDEDRNAPVQRSRAFTGNRLTLDGYRGAVKGLYNFEYFDWVLPADVVNQQALISITGSDRVNLDNTQHSIAMLSNGNRLNAGDQVTLISHATGSPILTTPKIEQGQFIVYDAALAVTNNQLVLSIAAQQDASTNPSPALAGTLNPKAKAFLEGRTAGFSLTNQGADMLSDAGMRIAHDQAKNCSGAGIRGAHDQAQTCSIGLFAVSGGGDSRYHSGSHVDVRDVRLALGVATGVELADSSLLSLGIFAEHAGGQYDTYNRFATGVVRGHGDTRYSGAGVLAQIDFAGTAQGETAAIGNNGLYLNTVLRAGETRTHFDSHDMTVAGVRGKYNSRSDAYSAMLGAGYGWALDAKQLLDVYGRYSFSHFGSDKVMIGNDQLKFASSESQRLRLGARYHFAASATITPFAGIAYEREFKGNSAGSAFDMAIEQPSLKGNTGIAEIGVTSQPWAQYEGLTLNAAVQGYWGKREGVSGNLELGWRF